MLEIKHLTKVYKTNGEADVKALDDVTVSFQKTGLVFLLGKSGSGKSTLLNLIGGLDEPTEGEIVVLGKSSKDFSGSDFDSYRNTYVGFIFQEYNILNEFNVEDNIALALELQGKRKDKDKIASILDEVELRDYAKRKPNTLSGGQKQRIAIARALVKDPQIIMADEPTGALDSVTGKQVFDTLKRLSETRLVLVVSHDREFAMQYGDRIIELKDGKIISDVSKIKEQAEQISPSIIKHGADTITIKQGAKLDHESLREIERFILQSNGDIIISKDNEDVANFKRVNHIDDSGSRERFDTTPPIKLPPSDEKAKFIRSKLPITRAIKIGASSLKLKPFRLILTILLSIFSFVMFGLFSTMMLYNEQAVLTQSFFKSDYEYITVKKQYMVRRSYINDDEVYTHMNDTCFTPDEVTKFGSEAFGSYSVYINSPDNITIPNKYTTYYDASISKIAALPENHSLRKKLIGEYPTGINEIAISSYMLECIKNSTYKDFSTGRLGEEIQINSAEDIIGKYLALLGKVPFKVTGVFDSGEIPASYDKLKTNTEQDYITEYMYKSLLAEGLHSLALVSEAFIAEADDSLNSEMYGSFQYFDRANDYFYMNMSEGYYLLGTNDLKVYGSATRLPITLFKDITTLAPNQVIISFSEVYKYFTYKRAHEEVNENYTEEARAYSEFCDYCEYLTDKYLYDDKGNTYVPSRLERDAAAKNALTYITNHMPIKINMSIFKSGEGDTPIGEFEVVGAFYNPNFDSYGQGFFCSQTLYDSTSIIGISEETNYEVEDDATYAKIMIPLIRNEASFSAILKKLKVLDDKDVMYSFDNLLSQNVEMVSEIVASLSNVFLVIGAILAVFASLMLFNFISLSISNKKKEIGILRAVGARGIDVFKIFFSESIIIVGICIVFSFIGTLVASNLLNMALKAEVGLDVAMFVFGPLSVLLMLTIALLVAIISTFLPVYFAAKKKPVDSIRAL